jgi:hypothetical protein
MKVIGWSESWFELEEGKRKAKQTMIGFFTMLGVVGWLGHTGKLVDDGLTSALWIPPTILLGGIGGNAIEWLGKGLNGLRKPRQS